jgi:hypothetical protein
MEWVLWAYRQVYWVNRKVCPSRSIVRSQISTNKLPWFWIGAELPTGTKAVTEIVNNYVRYGIRINPEFLQEVTGYTNAISWRYVDVETLEEKEFPSHGFVIENVPSN